MEVRATGKPVGAEILGLDLADVTQAIASHWTLLDPARNDLRRKA